MISCTKSITGANDQESLALNEKEKLLDALESEEDVSLLRQTRRR